MRIGLIGLFKLLSDRIANPFPCGCPDCCNTVEFDRLLTNLLYPEKLLYSRGPWQEEKNLSWWLVHWETN